MDVVLGLVTLADYESWLQAPYCGFQRQNTVFSVWSIAYLR